MSHHSEKYPGKPLTSRQIPIHRKRDIEEFRSVVMRSFSLVLDSVGFDVVRESDQVKVGKVAGVVFYIGGNPAVYEYEVVVQVGEKDHETLNLPMSKFILDYEIR